MGRLGVSFTEVSAAANELVSQGRVPTVEQVRIILGTGSSSTLAKHLRQWKQNKELIRTELALEEIPPELNAVIKGLWERVRQHSEDLQFSKIQTYERKLLELQQENEKYKKNNQRWQKMYGKWVAFKNALVNDKTQLEEIVKLKTQENSELIAEQKAFLHEINYLKTQLEEVKKNYLELHAKLIQTEVENKRLAQKLVEVN